jgi:glycosyltransferase involved in cell wall biosynthesis
MKNRHIKRFAFFPGLNICYQSFGKTGNTALFDVLIKALKCSGFKVNFDETIHKTVKSINWTFFADIYNPKFESFFSNPDIRYMISVRNPYTRILSLYLHITRSGKLSKLWKKKLNVDDDFIRFKDFLYRIHEIGAKNIDAHIFPISTHSFIDEVLYDHVIRFENFYADVQNLIEANFSKEDNIILEHHGVKTDSTKKVGEFYDEECTDLVQEIYRQDFDVLGYSKCLDDVTELPTLPYAEKKYEHISDFYKCQIMSKTNRKSKKMKILLLCPTLSGGKGGTERVASDLANAMANRNIDVYIAHKDRGQPSYSLEDSVNIFSYSELDHLKKFIFLQDPDVYFVFYFGRHLISFYSLIQSTNIPFGMQECTNPQRIIYNNWGANNKDNFPIPLRKWEREIIASGATRIRLTMQKYSTSFPYYINGSIRAFPNPAFPQDFHARLGSESSKEKVIVNIGGLKANKNLITILYAFASLAFDFPEWKIKVFGETADGDEPHKVQIRNFIRDKRLEKRVLICGQTDNVFKELAHSQIHVIASLSEGCPTCVLEAMATGLPSIGFAECPGTNELIRHGENGLLAASGDVVSSLRHELKKLMASAELRKNMGRKALQDSRQFAPETIYDKWEQLFYETAEYKHDPDRLFREQISIDPERAMHARRMREKLLYGAKW